MNWSRDNAGINKRDFEKVFKYKPNDTTVIVLSSEQQDVVRPTSLHSDGAWSSWLENLPRPNQDKRSLMLILSKRPEAAQTAAPRMGSIPIPHFGAGNKKTKSWTWKRQTTLPQDGGDLLLDNLQATSTGGERAVQTLSFSEETFRKIADHFFLHGSISKVISRADVPIFTHASLQMSRRGSTEAFSAYVYNCRSTNAWESDLALSVTYFPHCQMTYGILYGCTPLTEREFLSRLEMTDKSAWYHPLLLPGIFAELERGRHLEYVEKNIYYLEGEIFQMDFPPSLKDKIRSKEANIRNSAQKKAWRDTTYLRNGLVSWRTQLTKIAEHCDDLPRTLFNEQIFKAADNESVEQSQEATVVARVSQQAVELQQMRKVTGLVKDRILEIVDEYEDKIRDTTMRVDGLAMATQWSHGETNVEIAIAAIRDSRYMKSIALVTMVFLPGTFMASVFSMTFFDWGSSADLHSGNGSVSKWIWVYVVMTFTITTLTLLTWWYFVVFRERRRTTQTDEETALVNGDGQE